MTPQNPAIQILCNALDEKKEFSETLAESLLSLRFEVPASAWKNLNTLHAHANFENLYPHFFPDLLGGLTASYDPDRGLNNFERFTEKIYDKAYLYTLLTTQKKLLTNLLSLFSGSQYLSDLLLKEPETFNWLRLPETLGQSKLKDQLYRESWELISKCGSEAERYAAVRKFKKREYLRIGLRDLTRLAPLREIMREVSNLADVLLQQCYEFSLAELVEKHGLPYHPEEGGGERVTEFAVMGMGKLGGRELNYSSDIDLLYVYTSERGSTRPDKPTQRSISNPEFFAKLARKITAAMNKLTADGCVFRVDLGLRPEGASGDIASSLRSYEVYYESWGRTWERMALLKARPSAGSMALGNAFKDMCNPFVYRKYLDLHAIDEVKEMKEKINREVVAAKGSGIKNVKLGLGGIREIEFVAQVFNLIYGGKDKRIRENNLLQSLDLLAMHRYIRDVERDTLSEAYIFLRELEHRIQISYGLQTQEFSQDPKEVEILALKMGLTGENREALYRELEEQYARHTGAVREIYNRLFYEGELKDGSKQRLPPEASGIYEKFEIREESLSPFPFRDKKKTAKDLLLMRSGQPFSHPTEKSVLQFDAMLPKLLKIASRQPDPDQAVSNLERFVRRCDGRNSLYEMLGRSEEALALLLILFGGSELFSNTLIRQPYLLDSLFDPEWLHKFKPRETLDKELALLLSRASSVGEMVNKLRAFKKGEEFRIGVRYLIGETSHEDMTLDLSALAELYLEQILRISLDSLSPGTVPENCGFAVIGMGKLGGREIDYGSDLDLIFVYDERKAPSTKDLETLSPDEYYVSIAESIYKLTSQPTRVEVAYTIDTGLRPEGEMGTLAVSLQRFSKYLKKRAAVWERQSLIKGRFVAGDREVGEKFFKIATPFVYGESLPLSAIAEIRRLRKKVEEEARKAKGGVNVKLGPGGLMDIEFMVQLLQLKHGYLANRIRTPSTLAALARIDNLGLMNPADCAFLSDTYQFLRRVVTSLRINREGVTPVLPENPEQLRKLVLSLGCEHGGMESENILIERFEAECRERMTKTRSLYDRVFTVKTGESGISRESSI